jgi:VIT1/CCC1 family predicted Fe2+/Mn2+ transporter
VRGGYMEKLRGIASNVDGTVDVYPGRSKYSTRTVHVSRFQINGRTVKFESTRRQRINEGDHVAVAGTAHGRVLVALAYRNLTTGTDGHQSWFLFLVVGVVFTAVGFVPIYLNVFAKLVGVGAVIAVAMGIGIFLLFGGLGLYSAARTFQAIRALRKEAP